MALGRCVGRVGGGGHTNFVGMRLTFAPAIVSSLLAARNAPPMMGGFEQQYFTKDGARLALLVSADSLSLGDVQGICSDGRAAKGTIYGLGDGRLELVAEGERGVLEQLASDVESAAGTAASVRQAWQSPVGGYGAGFQIVELQPRMRTRISICGQQGDLDYIQRHLQLEAVFNRGLKLTKSRPDPTRIELDCTGKSDRLKSFLRWCYNGPPLRQPEEVKVEWIDP